jgi:ribosome-associated protein
MKAAHYALEKKATDIHVLDLREITSMTDYFVIATGSSDRQVKAIAENVIAEMRDTEGIGAWRSEGWDSLHWIIVDFVDFVVHVFLEESRKFYNIERLWADAPMVEVKDEIPAAKKAPAKRAVRTKKPTAKASSPKIKILSDSRKRNSA